MILSKLEVYGIGLSGRAGSQTTTSARGNLSFVAGPLFCTQLYVYYIRNQDHVFQRGPKLMALSELLANSLAGGFVVLGVLWSITGRTYRATEFLRNMPPGQF